MHVEVDEKICAAHALCAERAPHVFRLDDYGYARAIAGDVPRESEAAVTTAIAACPVQAIQLWTKKNEHME